MPPSIENVAEQYIADVLSGKQIVGGYIRKAIERHKHDVETAHTRGLHFDPNAGQYVIDFIQTFITPSESTEPIQLMPWQQAWLYILFGWKRADGARRFRRTLLEIAKKNGKTGLAAALSLYFLIADGEQSARVYIAATTAKQAKTCFREATMMRQRSSDLKDAIQQSGNEPVLALFVPETGSRLTTMARAADSEDGAIVSAAILDELHRWKTNSNLWSVLRYGGRTRKQPMLVEITTAGSNAGKTTLCWSEHEYGLKVLDGIIEDDEFLPFIFSLDQGDDWRDEKNWIKANPSLGWLFDLDTIRREFKEASGKPTELADFKRFCLNLWTEDSSESAIELAKWDACCRVNTKYPDPIALRSESLKQLKGKTCFAGLDLAMTFDTSALVLVFPEDGKFHVVPYFWIPENNIEERCKRDKVPYDVWRDQGFLTATPGDTTDYYYIADQIAQINKEFNLQTIAYDSALSAPLIAILEAQGFPTTQKMVEFRQGFNEFVGPCNEWTRQIIAKTLTHDADPVLRWQVSNLRWARRRADGAIKPDKSERREKNDGAVGTIMALDYAVRNAPKVPPDKRNYITLI